MGSIVGFRPQPDRRAIRTHLCSDKIASTCRPDEVELALGRQMLDGFTIL